MNFKDDFKEQLLTNRVLLIRELDPDSLLPYLLQCKMISLFHEEEIRSKPTRHERVASLLSILARRPDVKANLLNAMRLTNQGHIADKIEKICTGSVPVPTVYTLSDLADAVNSMKPGSTEILKEPPVSKIGTQHISALLFFKAFGQYVAEWHSVPSTSDFLKLMEIYDQELAKIKSIIDSLGSGGIHVVLRPDDFQLSRAIHCGLRVINRSYKGLKKVFTSVSTVSAFQIVVPKLKTLTQDEIYFLCFFIHLICFSKHTLLFTKTVARDQPNGYLMFNRTRSQDTIVMDACDVSNDEDPDATEDESVGQ